MALLTRLSRMVYRRTSEAALGVDLKRFVVLSYLRDHSGVTQHALAGAMCLDANTLVLLLNDLEAAGYVARRRDPADRRRHLVDMTAEGFEEVERTERALDRVQDQVLTGLGGADRAALHDLLRRALEDGERNDDERYASVATT
jgi:DNA-binding MarR family transcriptional regulator